MTKDANGRQVAWLHSANMRSLGADHGFTRRFGGVSAAPYDTLNLGFSRPENRSNVEENYRRLSEAAGFDYVSMVLASYCHGDGVEIVSGKDCGAGFTSPPLPACDGLVTNDKRVTLITLHADCMPVFLLDPEAKVIGLCHAGWKGVSMKIGAKVVRRMTELGARSSSIVAYLGPYICQQCFEVDAPVKEIFEEQFPGVDCIDSTQTPKYHIDLGRAMAAQLSGEGVKERNIEQSGLCTFEDESFFSYRRDSKLGGTGAMAAFMRIV